MTTHAQIIAAAKEAGINRAFVCANPDECPDDDGCCHGQKPDGYWVKDERLERFYTIAFNAGYQKASGRIEQLEAENAEWRAKAKNWMASPEAAKNLDGYRELGTKLAKLEAEREELKSIIALYDKAMTASWPEGARGEAFDHWNAARKIIAKG